MAMTWILLNQDRTPLQRKSEISTEQSGITPSISKPDYWSVPRYSPVVRKKFRAESIKKYTQVHIKEIDKLANYGRLLKKL